MNITETPETDRHTGLKYNACELITTARRMERERDALRKAINSALIELCPTARPSVCRRILREAMGEDPNQIYNKERPEGEPTSVHGECARSPSSEPMRYTGHVPCAKCGTTHWMHGPCPSNVTTHTPGANEKPLK